MSTAENEVLVAFWIGVAVGSTFISILFWSCRKRMLELLRGAPSDSGRNHG